MRVKFPCAHYTKRYCYSQYQKVNYFEVYKIDNPDMDKFEERRIKLRKLIDDEYKGVDAALASAAGIPPSYMSRMLYPIGKDQKKNITESQKEKIERVHPGALSDSVILTSEQRRMLFILAQLPEDMRPSFVDTIDGVASLALQNRKPSGV